MASKAYSVGTSTLTVVPDFTGAQTAAKKFTDTLARNMADALRGGIQNGLNPAPLQSSAARTGNAVGGTLADTIRGRLQAALRALPKVEVDASTDAATRKVEELRRELSTISSRVGVNLDSEQASARIATIEAELKALSGASTDLDLKANTDQASRALALIRAEVERLKGTTTVTVEANVGSFTAQVRRALERAQAALPELQITASTTPAQRELDALRNRLATLSGKTIGVDVSAEDALAELAAVETALTELGARTTDIDIDVNAAAAATALAAVRAEVERLNASRVVVPIEVNAGRFVATAAAAVAAAQTALPDLLVGLNSTPAQIELAALRAELATLGTLDIGVDIDAGAFYAEAQRIAERLRVLSGSTAEVDVKADAAAAAAELGAIDREVERLDGKTARIDVDSTSLNTFTGRIVLVGAALAALAPAALPAAGAAVVALGAIGAAAGAVLPAIGALVLGFSGVGGALSALSKRDEDAAKTAQQAAQQRVSAQAQVASSLRSVEGAEASLANARASAASAAARSAQAVQQAAAAVARAEQDAAAAVVDAQQRITEAQAALVLAQSDAAYSAEQSARRVADAQRELTRATDAAAAAVVAAEQRVADARDATAQAQSAAADLVVRALRDEADAERNLATAQQRSLDLQQALTDARTDAAQSLEDMQLRIASNALRAQQNTLDLADAQRDLAKVRADPTASTEDIARAELAVQQQQQAIDELAVANRRLQAQYTAASAAGVDGSTQVRNAQQAIIDQTQRVADAEQALADKRAAVTDAQVTGEGQVARAKAEQAAADKALTDLTISNRESIATAEQALADAQTSAQRQTEASTRSVASAQRDVVQASKDAADAQVAGAQRVADAQQQAADAVTAQAEQQRSAAASIDSATRGLAGAQASLAQAYATTGGAGVAAADAVATAFGKLGPAGATFATFLYGLRPQLDALKGAAAGGLLPGLQTAITALLPLMPTFEQLLTTFGTAIGQLAIDAANGLKSAPFTAFFDFLNTNGAAIVDTAGKIIGNLALIFPALATAFGPVGQVVGDVLVQLTGDLVDFLTGLANSDAFSSFLDYVKANAPMFASFLGSFVDALVQLVKSAAPFGPIILSILTSVFDLIASLPPGFISAIVLGIIGLVGVFNLLAPVIGFVSGIIVAVSAGVPILTAVIAALGGPVTLIIAGIVLLAAALISAYESSSTFRDIVNGAFGAVRDFVVGVIWEQGLKPTFEALSTFFTRTIPDAANYLWHNVFEPVFAGIGAVVGRVIDGVKLYIAGLIYVWQNVLQPAALFLWHNVFEPAFNGIRFVAELVFNVIRLAIDVLIYYWRNVLAPAALYVWHNVFEPVFEGVRKAVQDRIDAVRSVLDGLIGFWKNTLQPAAVYLRDNVFGPVFSGIGTAVKSVYDNVIKPVFDALSGFFTNTLGPAVSSGVDAFKAGFALMQAAAADPINFVIREVYTNGIKKLFDQVAVAVNSDARLPVLSEITVPKAAPVQRKASGGRIAGSSPHKRADNVPVMATAGEWMQPVDSVRHYGTGFMEAVRTRRFPRGLAQGLANGGTVEGLVALGHKLQGLGIRVSENKYFGGVTPGAHAANGWHYKLGGAGAIDLNLGTGNPKGEKEALDKAVAVAQQSGFRTLWQTTDHYDHAHADLGAGQSIGSGGGFLGSVIDGVKALGSSASEVLGDAWKGAKDMLSPFSDLIAKIAGGVGDSPFGKLTGDATRKVFGLVTDWVRDKASSVFGGSGDKGGSAGDNAKYSGGGVERWRATALKALDITGYPAADIGSLLRRMQQESSGDPRAINLTDSNAAAGHPSKGLMQTIDSTFRRWALPGYNSDIYDPLSNIIASIRYAASFPGGPTARWDRKGGYAMGGLIGSQPGQLGNPLLFDDGGRLPVGLSAVMNRTSSPEAVFNGSAERALLAGQSSRRTEELLQSLVALAGEGNDIAGDGYGALSALLDAQPRRAQQLTRQGVR